MRPRCMHVNETGTACTSFPRSRLTNMCFRHGGGNRCQHVDGTGASDCMSSVQTSKAETGLANMCIRHGGGDRCQHVDSTGASDCTSSAKISKAGTGVMNMCKTHGGGDRCQHVDNTGSSDCTTSVQTSKAGTVQVNMCIRHGGGDRCQHVDGSGASDCTSSARVGKAGTGMCVRHGGGDRCQHVDSTGDPDCTRSAVTSKTGITGMCKHHGGGNRCQFPCCRAVEGLMPTLSSGRHPESGDEMCRHAVRCYIASFADNPERVASLLRHFGLKKDLVLRGEHAFYHALCLAVPELRFSERVLDESILSKCLGKRKRIHDPRPDYFHYFSDGSLELGLHGEYDEKPDHEDNEERLAAVADASGCGTPNVYVFRVMAHHDTPRAVCKRFLLNRHYTYYKLTEEGTRVVEETAEIVRERLAWIRAGLAPNEDRPRKVYINFNEN